MDLARRTQTLGYKCHAHTATSSAPYTHASIFPYQVPEGEGCDV